MLKHKTARKKNNSQHTESYKINIETLQLKNLLRLMYVLELCKYRLNLPTMAKFK